MKNKLIEIKQHITEYTKKHNIKTDGELKAALKNEVAETRRMITMWYGMYMMRKHLYPKLCCGLFDEYDDELCGDWKEEYNNDVELQKQYDTKINDYKIEEKCEYKATENLAIEILQSYACDGRICASGWIEDINADYLCYTFPFAKEYYVVYDNDLVILKQHAKRIKDMILKGEVVDGITYKDNNIEYRIFDGRKRSVDKCRSVLMLIKKDKYRWTND